MTKTQQEIVRQGYKALINSFQKPGFLEKPGFLI